MRGYCHRDNRGKEGKADHVRFFAARFSQV